MRLTRMVLRSQILAIVAATAVAQGPPALRVVSLGECRLSSGAVLPNCRVAYRSYGKLNAARDNAVLIPTWLLGRSEDWQPLLTGDALVDTTQFYVIVVDALADGLSSSPSNTALAARTVFDKLTLGDMVTSQYRLLTERLGIRHLRAVMGFSMGGMQAIEWAVRYPTFIDKTIPIAGTPKVGTFNALVLTAMLDQIIAGKRARISPDSLWPALARTEMLFIVTPIGLDSRGTDSVANDIASNAANYRKWNLDDYAAQIAALRRYDLSAVYGDLRRAAAHVRAPMLAIYSWDDHMITPDAMAEFAKMLRADTLSISNRCGHITIFCEQRRVASATRAFIGSNARAIVDLTGTWATGSLDEPDVRRVSLQLQCNHMPPLWVLQQGGDTVSLWQIPESYTQGVPSRQAVSKVALKGRLSGSDLTLEMPGTRYVLHYDSASGHLRGTLNGAPFWAVPQDVIHPTGCIPPP